MSKLKVKIVRDAQKYSRQYRRAVKATKTWRRDYTRPDKIVRKQNNKAEKWSY